jgi:hypothetical protein
LIHYFKWHAIRSFCLILLLVFENHIIV